MRDAPLTRERYLYELRRLYLGERRVGLGFLGLGGGLVVGGGMDWLEPPAAPVGWAAIGVGWAILLRVIVRRTRWAATHRPEVS